MPEENFEQHARNMAERFSIEPDAGVWQRVEAIIAPPKRKRRILIWWWLLPLCMLGGMAVLFTKYKKVSPGSKTVTDVADNKQFFTKNKSVTALFNNAKLKKTYCYSTALHNREALQKQKLLINKRSNNLSSSFQKKKVFVADKYNSLSNKSNNKKDKDFIMSSLQKNTLLPDHDKAIDSPAELPENRHHVLNDDTDKFAVSPIADIPTTVNLKDSCLQQDSTSSVVIKRQKQKRSSYQVGLMAEIGIASLSNSLFSNETNNAISSGIFSPGTSNDLASGITTVSYKVKKGIDIAAGALIEKKLTQKIRINGQIAYRYQQFVVARTILEDTSANASNSSGVASGIYYNINEMQRLHSLNLYAGLGWQFFTGKKISLSLEGGLDNSVLIALNHSDNGQTQQRLDSVKSLTIKNVYQWQPYMNTAISFDWYAGKNIHLRLSPFARFGLHRFQKNSASYKDNHLVSAGIQAVYFFK